MTRLPVNTPRPAVKTLNAWLVSSADDPRDWVVRFEKAVNSDASGWAHKMVGNWRRAQQCAACSACSPL